VAEDFGEAALVVIKALLGFIVHSTDVDNNVTGV
jgi:hypothetical protein